MSRDRYRAGRRLSPKGLFQLVAEEAFKDGKIEPVEQEVLTRLARFLGIPEDSTRRIARQALSKFRKGELGTPRSLRPRLLYERTLYFVWSDGEEDRREEKMLEGLRRLFRIGPEEHREILERVRSPGYGTGSRIDEAPPTEELSTDQLGRMQEELREQLRQTSPEQAPASGPEPSSEPAPAESDPGPVPSPVPAPEPSPGPVPMPVPERAPEPSPRPAPVPAPEPSPPEGRPAPRRSVGERPGELRIPLLPGGVPVPLVPNLGFALLGIGAGGALLGVISLLLPEGTRLGEGAYSMAMALWIGTYWTLRSRYEASLLPPDAALVVSARGVRLPGVFLGAPGEVSLPRSEIEALEVTRTMRSREETIRVLHLRRREGKALSLHETALGMDFERACRELEGYLLRPVTWNDAEGITPQFRIFLVTLVALPLAFGLLIYLSSP